MEAADAEAVDAEAAGAEAVDLEAADLEAAEADNLNLARDRLLPLTDWEQKAVHYTGYTPLHVAVGRNDIDTMELLLAAKADAEARTTYHGWTPLILSALNEYMEACVTLRDHGVDERVKCREGKSAEDHAPEMFRDIDNWDVDYYENDYYGHDGYA